MTVKRMRWMTAVGVALGLPCLAAAGELVWRPIPSTSPAVAATTPAVKQGPIATLGRPIPLAAPASAKAPSVLVSEPVQWRPNTVVRAQAAESTSSAQAGAIVPVSATTDPGGIPMAGAGFGIGPPQPPVPEGLPTITTHTASGPPDSVPPPPAPPAADGGGGVAFDAPVAPTFWEKSRGWFTWGEKSSWGHCTFQSDTCFNGLISPVTNPFFFEDPRSLTEVRPIFMFQGVPSNNPHFGGGDAIFFGTQARLAFTNCFSVVINELGLVSLDPSHPTPPISSDTGFAEFKIGPKFTFLRSESTGTVMATGLTFELPIGGNRVYQNTGTLGLDPYLSIGQSFGRLPNGFGTINLLGAVGYNLATDSQRSEFFHMSGHIDYNIANMNAFYPLMEFNWLHYTSSGKYTNLGFEGGDLVNFGSSTRRSSDVFTLGFGCRYRFNDHIFAGGAVEFPLSCERGLMDYRLTFDVIFRY
jgi:hypothetical protein